MATMLDAETVKLSQFEMLKIHLLFIVTAFNYTRNLEFCIFYAIVRVRSIHFVRFFNTQPNLKGTLEENMEARQTRHAVGMQLKQPNAIFGPE